MKNKYAIGIDFGTTKSHLTYISREVEGQNPPQLAEYIKEANLVASNNDHPYRKMGNMVFQPVPTVLAIDKNSDDMSHPRIITGYKAIDRNQPGFENFVQVEDLKSRVTKVGKDRKVVIGEHEYAVEGLVAHFIWALRKYARDLPALSEESLGITISVPAKSSILTRMTMRFAAKIAGFSGKIAIVEEPVAAFLFHRHIHPENFITERRQQKNALIVDFGGGTCDVAIVQYEKDKLPSVIGRKMGRFGGRQIDWMFLKKFWLESGNDNSLPMSEKEFQEADTSIKSLLLAHARCGKENLANGLAIYKDELVDVFPNEVGRITTPEVRRNQFSNMLLEDGFETLYEGDRETRENNLEGHLTALIGDAIKDAQITRDAIDKLVLAGGSIQLPGVRDWILDYLRTDQGYDNPNKKIRERDVHDSFPIVSVAGGAAIHQLYRHHDSRADWKGAVRNTLSSSYWLINFQGSFSNETRKIELGKASETLPIDRKSYFKAKVIYPIKRWDDGRFAIEIMQGEDSPDSAPLWRKKIELSSDFEVKSRIEQWLKAILVRYYIDEYGILKEFVCTPGMFLTSWKRRKRMEKFAVLGDKSYIGLDLKKLKLDNSRRIDELRSKFIPK